MSIKDQGVIDSLSEWVVNNNNLRVLQTLVCVNKEWNVALANESEKVEKQVCLNVQNSCNDFINRILELQRRSATLTESSREDLKRVIRHDLVFLASITSDLIVALKKQLPKDISRSIVKCLHALARQRRSTMFLTEFGAPHVSSFFVKSCTTRICCVHGCDCKRAKKRVSINGQYNFEIRCRRNFVDFATIVHNGENNGSL